MKRGSLRVEPDEREFAEYLRTLAKIKEPEDTEALDFSQVSTAELRDMIERLTNVVARGQTAIRALRRRAAR
jgi:hypothetical protein